MFMTLPTNRQKQCYDRDWSGWGRVLLLSADHCIHLPVCLSTHLSGHLPRRGVSLEQSLHLVALCRFKGTLAIRPFSLFVSSLWRRGEAWILNMLHQSRVGGVGVTTLSSLQHDANVTESGVKVRSGGVLRAAWRRFEVLEAWQSDDCRVLWSSSNYKLF